VEHGEGRHRDEKYSQRNPAGPLDRGDFLGHRYSSCAMDRSKLRERAALGNFSGSSNAGYMPNFIYYF
jgi:hypothetical protein